MTATAPASEKEGLQISDYPLDSRELSALQPSSRPVMNRNPLESVASKYRVIRSQTFHAPPTRTDFEEGNAILEIRVMGFEGKEPLWWALIGEGLIE